MSKQIWICQLGAALLLSAAPAVSTPASARAPQSATTSKPKTRKKSSTSRKKGTPISRAQTAPTPDRVREIQTALQEKGAFEGQPNGKWDLATVEAMKKYQASNNLTPTGKIDALTLKQLGLGAETAGKGAPLGGGSSSPPL